MVRRLRETLKFVNSRRRELKMERRPLLLMERESKEVCCLTIKISNNMPQLVLPYV